MKKHISFKEAIEFAESLPEPARRITRGNVIHAYNIGLFIPERRKTSREGQVIFERLPGIETSERHAHYLQRKDLCCF